MEQLIGPGARLPRSLGIAELDARILAFQELARGSNVEIARPLITRGLGWGLG